MQTKQNLLPETIPEVDDWNNISGRNSFYTDIKKENTS